MIDLCQGSGSRSRDVDRIHFCFCLIKGLQGRWDDRAAPMLDYFLAFEESFNRFPGFAYEVQGVFQEQVDGRIKFFTYAVRE